MVIEIEYEFPQLKSSLSTIKAIMVSEGIDTNYASIQYSCGEQQAFLTCNSSDLF